jgi:hypothetical protein
MKSVAVSSKDAHPRGSDAAAHLAPAAAAAAPSTAASLRAEIIEIQGKIKKLEGQIAAAEEEGAKWNDPALVGLRAQLTTQGNLLLQAQQSVAAASTG